MNAVSLIAVHEAIDWSCSDDFLSREVYTVDEYTFRQFKTGLLCYVSSLVCNAGKSDCTQRNFACWPLPKRISLTCWCYDRFAD